jgi:CHRD domain
MKRLLTALVFAAVGVISFATVAHGKQPVTSTTASATKLTICHKTGSQSNTWRRITVSSNAFGSSSSSGRLLRAHMRHTGDAVVVGTAACPATSATPAPTATPPSRITICHKTGSRTNQYRRITVSSRAVMNPTSSSGKVLRGHMGHAGDLILPAAPTCPSGAGAGTGSQGVKLTATLRPSAPATTGSGTATVTIQLGKGQLCFTLSVTGLTNVTAAHIHRGSTGAVVVPLSAPTSGTASGCVNVEKALLQEILANPAAFYVNVHTMAFPNGQIRGDLSR